MNAMSAMITTQCIYLKLGKIGPIIH